MALLLATAILAFYIFKPFLIPLALAAIFAVALAPLHRLIMRSLGGRESLAALLTVLVSIICLVAPVALLSTRVVVEAGQFYTSFEAGGPSVSLDKALDSGAALLAPYVPNVDNLRQTIAENTDTYSKEAAQWVASHLGTAFSSVASALLGLFIFLIGLYYMLRDGERFKKAVMQVSPLAATDEELIFERLGLAINSVVRGNILIALAQGVLSTIGFSLFEVPNPVLWGTAAFFAALIPGIGTALVFIPVVAFMLLTGDSAAAFGLAVWGAIAVGMIDNMLGPRLVGRGMKLHPLLVLPGVLGGVALFGPAGIFLGPLTLSLLFALLSIHSSRQVTG